MYRLEYTTRFKKDLKKIKKSGRDYQAAVKILKRLQKGGVSEIPQRMRPHKLKGDYKDNLECHIKPDLLIIWFQIDEHQLIRLIRIGSHTDLFR